MLLNMGLIGYRRPTSHQQACYDRALNVEALSIEERVFGT